MRGTREKLRSSGAKILRPGGWIELWGIVVEDEFGRDKVEDDMPSSRIPLLWPNKRDAKEESRAKWRKGKSRVVRVRIEAHTTEN